MGLTSIYNDKVYSLFLSLLTHAATPNPPVTTNMNSLNTSISLTWTHDKTCFESIPVKYHIVLSTHRQPIVTDQLTTEIGGIISGRAYNVSVTAVVEDSQRSEPVRDSVTAGGNKEVSCLYCM